MDQREFGKRRIRRAVIIGSALLLAALGLLLATWWTFVASPAGQSRYPAPSHQVASKVPVPPSPLPQLYKPLAPDDALMENARLPFSTAPIERALPLVVPLDTSEFVGRRTAIDCLTAAIYYEAAQESETGKRGVAQVVLNRVRHPAFPNSVCGVVYQGSERRTGCQFTFTCDGSLARKPSRAGWDAARRIAVAALSGFVESSVGMATHYHADYVVPYWATQLDKIVKLGHHIFYRWSGSWGRRASFTQKLVPDEFAGDESAMIDLADIANPADPPPLPGAAPPISRIVADGLASALSKDEPDALHRNGVASAIKADATLTIPAADIAKGELAPHGSSR